MIVILFFYVLVPSVLLRLIPKLLEMARDEARHGKAFQDLLERYFER